MRNLHRWLSVLARENWVIRVGNAKPLRYKFPFAAAAGPKFGSAMGKAIHVLVKGTIQDRPPAEYHRVLLDDYRPNETA